MTAQAEEIKKVEATIQALEKHLANVQRENKQLDYEMARNNPNAPAAVSSKISSMTLSRVNHQRYGSKNSGADAALSGRISNNLGGARTLRNQGKKPSVSTSVDLTGRLHRRFESLQTPNNQIRSNIDQNHNKLEQILSKQEHLVSKSLVSEGGMHSRLNSLVPRSTRNKAYGNVFNSRDIGQVNVSVIPPPTSIHQHEILGKRARKFSAKMSTQIGSERGDSRNGIGGHRYLGRNKRSIT